VQEVVLNAQAEQLAGQGQHRQAFEAFRHVAAVGGRHEETALYEMGRLQQRHLGDPAGALAAFEEYRRRFPDGALRQKVDHMTIESLVALRLPERALAEIARFLRVYPSSGRRLDIELLRAHAYRGSGLARLALKEYDEIVLAVPGTPAADDADYFAAECELSLGRPEVARGRLEEYVMRYPSGRHRSAAQAELARSARR
jgi:tetratricopeptide (TPR) repeat protein